MITWLQNFFLKHNKWLFGGLLVVIIVTFVLTIGPQSFFGSGGSQQRKSLKFYGYDLSSEADQRELVFTAEISAYLHPEFQLRNEQLMNYAYMRAAALGIAEQIGIPAPTQDALAGYVETLGAFQNPQTGEFSAEAYQMMIDVLQNRMGYDRQAIASVLREDYRIAQVRDALGGTDYSLPFELKQDYLEEQTRFTVQLAHFDFASFNPEINPTEEALRTFFNENPARYEIPESLSVTALQFNADAYLDEVPEPSEADLQAYFTANRPRYEADRAQEQAAEEDAEASEEELPEITLDDVRDSVLADWKRERARDIAARKSEQFSIRLWQDEIPLGSEAYAALVSEFEVQAIEIPPYTRENPPRSQIAGQELFNSMWIYANNPRRYFSDMARTQNGAVLLVKRDLTEARLPEFEEVQESVTADYVAEEKRRLFSEQGTEYQAALKERLATESFEEAAEALGLEVVALDPFTGDNPAEELLASPLWDETRYLDEGELSELVLQAEKASFAYVVEKSAPEFSEESAEYQAYVDERTGQLSQAMGWARLREITDQSLSSVIGTTAIN